MTRSIPSSDMSELPAMRDRSFEWRRPITWAENGWVPDPLIRRGIRRLLAARLAGEQAGPGEASLDDFVRELDGSPIALATDRANEQHYELPAAYFDLVLGARRKYSGTYWPEGVDTLDASEEAMLALTAERADLADGQRILELGCGWGSFTLWAAERFPRATIVGLSNSRPQRAHILAAAAARGLRNVEIRTADMNTFAPGEVFDRVVSIEMFEHMKNYRELMRRIATWLVPGGRLFVHIFTHRQYAYHFLDTGREGDWMAHYFFAGGTMPSDDLLLRFQDDLRVEGHWRINGGHYQRTLEAWLKRHDARRAEILELFRQTYGTEAAARRWFHRWRLFYLSCAELFGFRHGREWMVSHYRFQKPA
jgi:cyclopropane-fatty-acyl-phospholipid synthase